MLKKAGNLIQMQGDNAVQVVIKNAQTAEILAAGQQPNDVFKFEGNWYFEAEQVTMDNLTITERTYTCPYKGTCNWIDLTTPQGTIQNVAWIYPTPKQGYTQIQNRIAFYNGSRQGTITEID